ncbi:cytochrome P450 [Vararia minispora EC-137]|uniref:Cytochrome P450 n=1 Tax=Vararia minispora EC-137 TaxID=1314806 RepID=A0ACB8QBA2_9AGAM|nr:cytochrome P450 [Vararia minispora EC-137]
MISFYLFADAIATVACLALIYQYLSRKSYLPFPPGPPRLPIIGNAFDIPEDYAWKQYAKWSEKYGDVISLQVFGQTIVIINSHSALRDIVLKRSATFTGRPYHKFSEMTGLLGSNIVMTNGNEWRERRRIIENSLKPVAMQMYRHSQTCKILKLLKRVLSRPDEIFDHTREYTGAFVLDIAYGYDVQDSEDRFVKDNEEFINLFTRTILPGALIVNTLPILGRLPPKMLGQEFADLVERVGRLWKQVVHEPYKWVKEGMLTDEDVDKEQVLVDGLGNTYFGSSMHFALASLIFIFVNRLFAAAIDTTTSASMTFILCMVLNPHVQAKAHEELDRVIGRERMPSFYDRPNLPYIGAVYMEILRWDLTAPLGIQHTPDKDVVCGGFYIPKGASVIGNAWAILHDPVRYPEPDVFRPERHLSSEGRIIDDPYLEYAFGYGTRKCPGRHFADATIWLYIVTVLTFFEIRMEKDARGMEIPINVKFETRGTVRGPLPFPCTLVPRDREALERIFQQS